MLLSCPVRPAGRKTKSICRSPGWRYPFCLLPVGFVLVRVNGAAGLALGACCLMLAPTPLLWSRALMHDLRARGARVASPLVMLGLTGSAALWVALVLYMQAIRRA